MNMSTPRLEIYFDTDAGLCVSKVEKPNADPRLIVNVPVNELEAMGSQDAAYRVGGTVLNILRIWHKDAFDNLEVPSVSEGDINEDYYCVALRLIDLSLGEKTSIHNASIEVLLRRAAVENEEAKKYLEETWPLLRDRLP